MEAPAITPIFLCDDITAAVVADGGDGNDEMSAHLPNLAARMSGGEGDDLLLGAQWAETLDGGPGDDELVWGGGGADVLIGGEGTDLARVNVLADPPPPVSITLDGLANDGPAGSGLDVRSDVED
ncbi:MAG: hypothetical protein HOQ03_07610, partial [Thermoleophilia bacterium]|nr:hypothetical protein [Thermoleophilia bacterium]